MIARRMLLSAAVLGLWCSPLLAQSTPGPDAGHGTPASKQRSFEARLAAVDEMAGAVKALTADFEQRKHTPLMMKPLVSSGRLAVKGDRVRWDTRKPHESVMTMGGGEVRLYYPDQRVVEVYDLGDDVRQLTGSPIPRLAAMKGRFDIKEIEITELGAKPDQPGLLAVELTPRTDELKKHVARVRVLIDTAIPCATLVETTDPDGERTEIRFTNVKVNPDISDRDVRLDVPKGVRVEHPLEGRTEPQGEDK